MEHDGTLGLESLLEHGPRLRALARRLIGEGGADDLVQDTWLRAVERGRQGAPWRWLARVLRNRAIETRRAEATRSERERGVARDEAPTDEGERFAMHRELVAAIERLAEPYRNAILLRWFDGLPPRRIAARLGVPVKTVKTRLNRGLALLRAELDRRAGGRETWLAALVPLARAPTPVAGLAATFAAAAVVAGTASLWFVTPRGAHEVEPLTAAPTTASLARATPAEAGSATVAPAALPARVATPGALAPPGTFQPQLVAGTRRGRVLDTEGAALAGMLVGFEGDAEPVVSGADGGFVLPDLLATVVSRDERFATVFGSRIDPARAEPGDEHVVVVAPPVTLAGIVLEGNGGPAAGVEVRIDIPLSFRGRFREVLDHSIDCAPSAQTDDTGAFRLERIPALACAQLEGHRGHSVTEPVPVPTWDEFALELRLTNTPGDPGPDARHVIGEVRHASGAFAAGALVTYAGLVTRSDATGLFELRVPRGQLVVPRAGVQPPEPRQQLVAVRAGAQPAVLDLPPHGEWPSFVTLWLGGPPESIAGQVVREDGMPLGGAAVWIDDPDYLANAEDGFFSSEGEMDGRAPAERWPTVEADASGRFELCGLMSRNYQLAALDRETLEIVRSEPVAAGRMDVRLAFGAEERIDVAGRVVDTRGRACVGFGIVLERETCSAVNAGGVWGMSAGREAGATDALGAFAVDRVPRSGVKLEITGPARPRVRVVLDRVDDPAHIEVVVPFLGHLQVALAGAPPARGRIELRDDAESAVPFHVVAIGSIWTGDRIDLGNPDEFAGGQTPVLSVPESVRAAVLLDADGNELRRAAVTPGDELVRVVL